MTTIKDTKTISRGSRVLQISGSNNQAVIRRGTNVDAAGRSHANVVSICSSQKFNPLTEAELEDLAIARRCARRAALVAITKQMEIEDRLRRGAKIEGRSQYDYDLASSEIIQR